MSLNSKKLRLLLIGLLVFSVALFVAIIIVGLSKLSSASNRMVDLKVQSQTAENQLANLEISKKNIEKYSYFKNVAATVIPSDKNQAEAVLETNKMADDAGISIQSITFPASNLGISAGSTASPNTLSQAKPVSGIPGLYSLELTITPDTSTSLPPAKQVTYSKMLDFLKRIENNRHTAQITQVNIEPGANGKTLGFVLSINIFIKP